MKQIKIPKICNLYTFWPVIQLINLRLKARMSRSCSFLLFFNHSYQVYLSVIQYPGHDPGASWIRDFTGLVKEQNITAVSCEKDILYYVVYT